MDFPDFHARQTPEKAAYVVGDEVVTYRELVEDSIRIANLLRARGVVAGDVVAFLLPNSRGIFEVAWACQRSGLRYTAINTHLTPGEIAYILEDSGAVALISCSRYAEAVHQALPQVSRDLQVLSIDGGAHMLDMRPLLAEQPTEPTGEEREGVDLLYSSGTTGRPKGVASSLSLAPLGTAPGSGPWMQATWSFGADSVYLSPAPLYHAAPMRFCQTVQRFGGTVVVLERFDPVQALEAIAQHRVTHTQMVPTMFVRMLQMDEAERLSYDVSSLRVVIHAAAPCPPEVKRQMIEWLGPIVDEYYASTENILMTVIRAQEALERPGSVGRSLLGIIHILDDDGNEVPAGTPGNIWSEGGLDFVYLNAPEKTAESRNEQGWRTVGDIGYLDEEGYLFLSDRRVDLILAGGVNVYPQEAENTLIMHPQVADVAVIGIPDRELGEVVKAVIQLKSDVVAGPELEAELIAWCQERISRFKCPRSIDFTDEMPRTPTGKLLRRVLRDAYRSDGSTHDGSSSRSSA